MFGIHIGNTNACIAFCKENGGTEVIANEGGERVTPTAVAIMKEEITVGTVAKVGRISNSKATITGNKTLMGIDKPIDLEQYNDIKTEIKNGGIYYCIPLEENMKYITPDKIAIFIFKKLHVIAKSVLRVGEEGLSCVLLVPGDFSCDYCEKYKNAAQEVGWTVLQIINEAAATVLAFSLLENKDEAPQNVLVYRLGGTTCEVTGCEITEGMMSILGSISRDDIGGNLFISDLVEFLADEFFRKYKLDPRENKRSREKLKQASENFIHILSNMPTVNCFIESLQEGIDLSVSLSRARFELLIKPSLKKCTEPMKILKSKLQFVGPIDKVILCGGATNIPKLKNHIASSFDQNITQIITHNNPDEVMALGAAKQAYFLHCNSCAEFLPKAMDIFLDSPVETYD